MSDATITTIISPEKVFQKWRKEVDANKRFTTKN